MANQNNDNAQAAADAQASDKAKADAEAQQAQQTKEQQAAQAQLQSNPMINIDLATLTQAFSERNKIAPVFRVEGMDEGPAGGQTFVNAAGVKVDVEGKPVGKQS